MQITLHVSEDLDERLQFLQDQLPQILVRMAKAKASWNRQC
jgi:hypothetical protein